jgi:hypothetical protein
LALDPPDRTAQGHRFAATLSLILGTMHQLVNFSSSKLVTASYRTPSCWEPPAPAVALLRHAPAPPYALLPTFARFVPKAFWRGLTLRRKSARVARRNSTPNNRQNIMAVILYSDISTQITNFNLLRTGFRVTYRHECLPAER